MVRERYYLRMNPADKEHWERLAAEIGSEYERGRQAGIREAMNRLSP